MIHLQSNTEHCPEPTRDESLGGSVAVIGVLLGVLAIATYPAITTALLAGVTILWLSARTYPPRGPDTERSIPGITAPRSRRSRRTKRHL